ncbi:MAG: putative bifunctional diguanylate cyclase/phosphodiesterase, partial [Spirochaetota bacterium]
IGDLLLENTANRIREAIRSSDVVFRFDGTNLVVLLANISRPTDAAMVAQKIADDVGVPYQYRGRVIAIDTHIGISLYPDDANDPEDLVHRANSSSVEAEERRLAFLFHDAQTHEEAVSRMTTLSDLHTAISAGALELYYHPIVRLTPDGAQIAGAEALIRWNHPSRGMLGPDDFIELAEGSRLIAAIDKLAMFNAVACLDEWFASYDLFLTLNVSAHEFKDHFLPEIVEHALARHTSIPPDRLKLEITERRSIEDLESSLAQMKQLQEIGVDVWIDDFGSGQSSLSLLKQLPATALKIDRGLVEGIDERENDRRYLAGIVESIRARGKTIVVEGVWNAEQARIVESLGCDYVQGFHFARPMRAEAFARFLSEGIGRLAAGCLRR